MDACLQPSCHSTYSIVSPDFQKGNSTASLLRILQAPWPETEDEHVSQVPGAIVQASNWTC